MRRRTHQEKNNRGDDDSKDDSGTIPKLGTLPPTPTLRQDTPPTRHSDGSTSTQAHFSTEARLPRLHESRVLDVVDTHAEGPRREIRQEA